MSHSKKVPARVQRMPKRAYEKELERLQIELVSMQQWVIDTGARVVVIFEGRDAAGKGGAIKRIMQYLNPRSARVVALPTPSEREKGQWSRINTISHLLSQIPYESRDPDEVTIPPRPEADDYDRPDRERYKYVPDHAGELAKK